VAIGALRWPATEKRQGTKSREIEQQRLGSGIACQYGQAREGGSLLSEKRPSLESSTPEHSTNLQHLSARAQRRSLTVWRYPRTAAGRHDEVNKRSDLKCPE
jgi:hypothetical protein